MATTTQHTPTTISVALATTLASLPLLTTAPAASAENSDDAGWPPAGWREVETCVGNDPEWCAAYWLPPL